MGLGAAVGLALLVLVANAGTTASTSEALRLATADGLRAAVLVVAAGIAATALVALRLGLPVPGRGSVGRAPAGEQPQACS